MTKISMKAATMPGTVSGRITMRKARHGQAPRLSAANSNCGSSRNMTPRIGNTAKGNTYWIIPSITAVLACSSTSGVSISPKRSRTVFTRPLSRRTACQATILTSTLVQNGMMTRAIKIMRQDGLARQIAAANV